MSEKFEKHNDNLFRMLEENEIVPLTPDAEMPCLIRLIQDDSPMGRYNKAYSEYKYGVKLGCCLLPIIATHIGKNGVVNDIEWDINRYEIIGYPVADGSAEWALYQMMQGKMVCHKTSRWDWYRMYNDHAIQNRTAGCMARVSAWLESTVQSGWQIYEEPKPTFKVGDWVDCKDFVGVPTQCKVLEIQEHNVIVECKTGHRWSLPHNNITRKLSPSEIIVNIGCMSGTVKDLSYVEDGRFWFIGKKTERCPGGMHAILYGEMLDTPTRSLVDSLLKAQEEE